jgi:hypothetical protein
MVRWYINGRICGMRDYSPHVGWEAEEETKSSSGPNKLSRNTNPMT